MQKVIKYIIVIAALAISGAASAHEGHDHGASKDESVKGTLKSVDGNKLVVKPTDGKALNVHVDDHTKYENGDAEGALADLKPGIRVVVHGEPMKDGTLHANKVRFATGGKSAPKPASGPAKDEHGSHAH